MECQFINPNELAAQVSAIAIIIAQGHTASQNNILANIFSQIGQTLATIASQQEAINSCLEDQKNDSKSTSTSDSSKNDSKTNSKCTPKENLETSSSPKTD